MTIIFSEYFEVFFNLLAFEKASVNPFVAILLVLSTFKIFFAFGVLRGSLIPYLSSSGYVRLPESMNQHLFFPSIVEILRYYFPKYCLSPLYHLESDRICQYGFNIFIFPLHFPSISFLSLCTSFLLSSSDQFSSLLVSNHSN